MRSQAALRLNEAGANWADASARTGYYDQPHVDRVCKATTGRTPSAFCMERKADLRHDAPDFVDGQVTSAIPTQHSRASRQCAWSERPPVHHHATVGKVIKGQQIALILRFGKSRSDRRGYPDSGYPYAGVLTNLYPRVLTSGGPDTLEGETPPTCTLPCPRETSQTCSAPSADQTTPRPRGPRPHGSQFST